MMTAAERGNGSLVKNFNFCGTPLSRTLKSLGCKPPIKRPSASATHHRNQHQIGRHLDGVVKILTRSHILGHAARRHRLDRASAAEPSSIPSNLGCCAGAHSNCSCRCPNCPQAAPAEIRVIHSWPGLGASGGGIGRVADGASGMSSGFCCAAKVPVSRTISKPAVNPTLKNDSPSPSRTLIFVAIRNPLSFFLPRPASPLCRFSTT